MEGKHYSTSGRKIEAMDVKEVVITPPIVKNRLKNYVLINVFVTTAVLVSLQFMYGSLQELLLKPAIFLSDHIKGYRSGCQIPTMDPFDKSILQFVKPVQPLECHNLPQLTALEKVTDSRGGYVIRIQQRAISSYNLSADDLRCCYSSVTPFTLPVGAAFGPDAGDLYNITKCLPFRKETRLKPQDECILIHCFKFKNGKKNARTPVYSNMHSLISLKPKVKSGKTKLQNVGDKLNILILGYDSMSQQNLLRTMPKTVQFLEAVGFVNFRGYTRIGENEFSNAMAMLTGLTVHQARRSCVVSSGRKDYRVNGKIDDCPFIWKDYQEQGYVTANFEDFSVVGSKGQKLTFVRHPTDYYIQPYMKAAEMHLTAKKMYDANVCLGTTSTTDHVFNYLTEFLTKFKKYSHFSYTWLENFSQNDVNFPGAMDVTTLKFFLSLASHDIYNDTVVVFVSSYGIRRGEIRSTIQGWYEERMPFLYISVPQWFKKEYHNEYMNLLKNRDKLVSAYDLHATLEDLLRLSSKEEFKSKTSTSVKQSVNANSKCRSLFCETLDDRTCKDVGIPEEYCVCNKFRIISGESETVLEGVIFAIFDIRRQLGREIKSKRCALLYLRRVVEAKYIKVIGALYNYIITFETYPGTGVFRAYLVRNEGTKSFALLGAIQRLSSSSLESNCVVEEELKKFCYCIT